VRRIERFKMATIRIEPELWRDLERLAREDRRPVANLLRLVLNNYVAAKSGQAKRAAA
jgi:predicted transcriptional regulator